jgi:hypothetical protein
MLRVYQEEGGYEYAAYHAGSEPSGQEPHLEEGLLYQPLGEGGEAQTKAGAFGLVPLCRQGSDTVDCARFALSIGGVWQWATHHLHKLVAAGVGALATVVVGGTPILATTGCAASAAVYRRIPSRRSTAIRSPLLEAQSPSCSQHQPSRPGSRRTETVDGSPTGSRDVAERRANTVLRASLLVFGLAYLAFAIVGYRVTGELGNSCALCMYLRPYDPGRSLGSQIK